jgi:hypothetical protein
MAERNPSIEIAPCHRLSFSAKARALTDEPGKGLGKKHAGLLAMAAAESAAVLVLDKISRGWPRHDGIGSEAAVARTFA